MKWRFLVLSVIVTWTLDLATSRQYFPCTGFIWERTMVGLRVQGRRKCFIGICGRSDQRDAKKSCSTFCARLAEPDDETELEQLRQIVRNNALQAFVGIEREPGTDSAHEWRYATRPQIRISPSLLVWGSGEPDNGKRGKVPEDCALFEKTGILADYPCTGHKLTYICENERRFDTCSQRPCRNGGTCRYELRNCEHSYRCSCPQSFSGKHCEFHARIDQCATNELLDIIIGLSKTLECSGINPTDEIGWHVNGERIFLCGPTQRNSCNVLNTTYRDSLYARRTPSTSSLVVILTDKSRTRENLVNSTLRCVSNTSGEAECKVGRIIKKAAVETCYCESDLTNGRVTGYCFINQTLSTNPHDYRCEWKTTYKNEIKRYWDTEFSNKLSSDSGYYDGVCRFSGHPVTGNKNNEGPRQYYLQFTPGPDEMHACTVHVFIDECLSNPCLYGGTCTDIAGRFRCSCPADYTGLICEKDLNQCESTPCQNGGLCIDYTGYYICECPKDTTGTNCEYRANFTHCATDKVWLNITVWEIKFVDCIAIHPQDTIEWHVNGTTVSECLPGASSCSLVQQAYRDVLTATRNVSMSSLVVSVTDEYRTRENLINSFLSCSSTTSGQDGCRVRLFKTATVDTCYCENDSTVGRVAGHCLVNKTLSTDPDVYTCAWNNRFNNVHESSWYTKFTDITVVDSGYYNGFCSFFGNPVSRKRDNEGPRQYFFKFTPGPDEMLACTVHVYIDECLSNPCLHGGTCIDTGGSFTCVCPANYTGIICSADTVDQCQSVPCQNGGLCIEQTGYYTCECPTGSVGRDCETDLDDCVSQPCLHNGTCIDHLGYFICQCSSSYRGKTCERDVKDQCYSDPCLHGGTCMEILEYYKCRCKKEYRGSNCETRIYSCDSYPCINGGTCIQKLPEYHECRCPSGFTSIEGNCTPKHIREGLYTGIGLVEAIVLSVVFFLLAIFWSSFFAYKKQYSEQEIETNREAAIPSKLLTAPFRKPSCPKSPESTPEESSLSEGSFSSESSKEL